MEHRFEDLFDIPRLTELCQRYTEAHGIVTALLDLDGKVHIQTGWQRICTQFHRVNPTTAQRCLESDTVLASALNRGETYNIYRCKNGLVDVAIPVRVSGEHVANFFSGQFFLQTPDRRSFERQGKDMGFSLPLYMDALARVPVFDEREVRAMVTFLANLAQMFGEMGKARLNVLELREAERQRFDELQTAHRELERLATEDPLTGLKNRRVFSSALDVEFYRAGRYRHDLSLLMVDVDDFKSINDSFGHAAGDEILKSIAKALASSVRRSDVVARIGGDEFCVLFPEVNTKDTLDISRKLCAEISSLKFRAQEEEFSISCSFGVASYSERYQSPEQLLASADRALYEAKAGGRNRVVCG